MKGRATEMDGDALSPSPSPPRSSWSSSAPPAPSLLPVPVLFLDVDGVLNTRASPSSASASSGTANGEGFSVLHGSLLQRLATVVRATNARVVLSSTWRLDTPSRERLRRRLCAEFFPFPLLLRLECTPVISTAELLRRLYRDKEDQVVLTVNTVTTVAAAADTWRTDVPAVQRVREILQWIQQNQVPLQSTASGTHSSSTTISNSAVFSTSDGAISTCANGKNNTNNSNSSSSSSNKHPINPVAEQLAWVALDDLDLQRAAASASGLMAHASRHFVQTNPERGLSVDDAERLIELLSGQQQQQHLQSMTAGGGRDEAEAPKSSSLRWSSAARALQQRADLLFVVDSRATAAAAITHPAMCEPVVMVVVVDTSTFQVVTALRSVDAAKDWVSASDGVALFDDSQITILQIVDDDEEEEAAEEEGNSASPSPLRPAEDQVDEPDSPLSWLRRRPHALVKWARDELQDGVEQLPWSGSSFALTVAEQLCNEATVSSGATKSHPLVGSSSPPPKLLLLRSLLTHLTELEMQQFDAQMAQERFSQCGFSHPQRAFLAKNPSIAMDLLHLLPLANLHQLRSSSSSAASLGSIAEAKRSRYCELLLSICKLFPLVTQSLLRQHLGEYVARDELTSLAALEAIAFAVRCGNSSTSREDNDGALLLDQLDELICCC